MEYGTGHAAWDGSDSQSRSGGEQSTYSIGRGHKLAYLVGGYLAVAFGLAYVAGYLLVPNEISMGLALFGAVFFIGIGGWSVVAGHAADSYAVELTRSGIRRLQVREIVPWEALVGFRERRFLQRIDLLGVAGPTGIRLEYQLDRFEDLLLEIVSRVRHRQSAGGTEFASNWIRTRLPAVLVPVLIAAGGIWLWAAGHGPSGLALAGIMGGAFAIDYLREVRVVRMGREEIEIARPLHVVRVPIDEITSVRLGLRKAGKWLQLDVFVSSGGKERPIRPHGVGVFSLYAAVSEAIEQANVMERRR